MQADLRSDIRMTTALVLRLSALAAMRLFNQAAAETTNLLKRT